MIDVVKDLLWYNDRVVLDKNWCQMTEMFTPKNVAMSIFSGNCQYVVISNARTIAWMICKCTKQNAQMSQNMGMSDYFFDQISARII